MRCGSRTVDAWFGASDDFGRLEPFFIASMIILGSICLSRRRCRWGEIFRHNSALFLFYAYLFASVTWAVGVESPAVKILRPLGDLIMALIIATERNPREAIMTMFRRCAILLIPLSIVLIRYYPDLGRGQDKHWGPDPWIGVSTHKNPLGQLCLVSALGWIWSLDLVRQRGGKWMREPVILIYGAMTLYLFNGGGHSRSSTAIVCLLFAIALSIAVSSMRDRVRQLFGRMGAALAAIALLALTLNLFGTSLQAVVAEVQGKDATLSDRTYLWKDVVRLGMQHPILGSGYGGFWTSEIYSKLSPEVDNRPAESHNGYLETFANLGFVGVAMLVALLWQSLASAFALIRSDFEYGRMRLVMLATILLMNYTEATFPRGTHLWWFCFLIVAIYARPWVFWPQQQPARKAYTLAPAQPEPALA